MCRISKETTRRASLALRSRLRVGEVYNTNTPTGSVINVSTKICGHTYSRELTFGEIKKAYGTSLQSVKVASAEGQSMPGAMVKIVKQK